MCAQHPLCIDSELTHSSNKVNVECWFVQVCLMSFETGLTHLTAHIAWLSDIFLSNSFINVLHLIEKIMRNTPAALILNWLICVK